MRELAQRCGILPASLSAYDPGDGTGRIGATPPRQQRSAPQTAWAFATKGRALFSTMALDSERIYEEIAAAIGAEKLAALYKSLDYVIDTLGDSGMPAEDEDEDA